MYDYICMIIYVYVKNTNPITYICTYLSTHSSQLAFLQSPKSPAYEGAPYLGVSTDILGSHC